MVSTRGVAENDDSEACDNIFQTLFITGHLMSRNLYNVAYMMRTNRPAENGK